MKVIAFKKIATIKSTGYCGTGYDEPDVFEVTTSNPNGDTFTDVIEISKWYCPIEALKEHYLDAMNELFAGDIENLDEGFEIYAKESLKGYEKEYSKEKFKKIYGFEY